MSVLYGLNSFLRETAAALAHQHRVQIAGASDSFIQISLLGLLNRGVTGAASHKRLVIVVPTTKDLSAWGTFVDQAIAPLSSQPVSAAILPFFSSWGADRFVNPSLSRKQRIYALALLAQQDKPAVVVTTLQGLSQKSLSPSAFAAACIHLKKDEERDLDELCQNFEDLSYIKVGTVEEEGTYAIRGGIVDIFPLNSEQPARLEFLGDSLLSLRQFSAVDQKSTSSIDHITIAPAAECLLRAGDRRQNAQKLYNALLEQDLDSSDRDGLMHAFQSGLKPTGFDMFAPLFRDEDACSLDFITPRDLIIFPKSIETCTTELKDYLEELQAAFVHDQETKKPSLPVEAHFSALKTIESKLFNQSHKLIEFGNPYATKDVPFLRLEGRTVVEGAPLYQKEPGPELFDKWVETISSVLKKEDGSVAILAHHAEQIERITNLLSHRELAPIYEPQLLGKILSGSLSGGRVYLGLGDLASHLWLAESSLLILPEHALFGTKRRKAKPASAKLQNYLSSFKDLKVNDLVVHVQHGIGRYKGLTSLAVGGLTSDFLIIEYAGSDKIYLPVDRLNLLQRYSSGADGAQSASLDRLGGPAWEKRKARVKGEIVDMANGLLRIQAQRQIADAHRYSPPNDAYFQFEAEFPYEETEDQLKALQDVFEDLASARPMDRLVCGDVGFGKTEIALRAALRAVLEGLQVIVLVPTTILCYQHYRTFADRLSKHGVKVAQVNRFVDAATMRQVLDDLSKGRVDVVVGTHRILSKDIKPKRLGLLVVDEEQRFGVIHKEKLKELRANADVLTMTATPIPRTLHMAMLGLRDISIIATPPQDRLAVKTYISRFDESLIRDAIEQEVKRGGQVFFIHNRVEDIEEMRLFIKSLVPQHDIRVAHGQMREHQLEKVILDFLEQKFPVLLCTTIIESGIDMPNVNTLIVNRADRFGLAQLYQIRGRVGRSTLQAYAYLLTPAEEALSDDARHRLEVLSAHQELGAGFQIASHDLEIRGAGNLLGSEQSGHAAEVGLEMYTEMLETAIAEIRGEQVKEKVDTEIKIPISAVISDSYIKSESQRLHLYKSLFSAETEEDLVTLRQEVADRFGPLPEDFLRLLRVAGLKRLLRIIGATTLSASPKGFYEIKFGSLNEKQIDRIVLVVNKQPTKYRLSPDYRLFLYAQVHSQPSIHQQEEMLTTLIAMIQPLAQELEQR